MAEGPDKGRAWLIAVAALVSNMITAGLNRASGILFVELIDFYRVDRKRASLPIAVRGATRNILAPVVGILGEKYGIRTVMVTGSILGAVSSALCVLAPNITWLVITWGLLNGFAMALVTVLPQVVICQYFIKQRASATGLSLSGGCIGGFILPTIIEFVIHTYGLDGAFLILAGFVLNNIPVAMLMKAPPWIRNNKDRKASMCPQNNAPVETTNNEKCRNMSSVRKCECGVQVGNDRIYDIFRERKLLRDNECRHHTIPRARSYPNNNSLHQMHLCHLQRSSVFPSNTSMGLNFKTLSSNPENIFDVDIEYLKRNSDLVFHMLSMEIPNVEISYRAILLEVEQDDLWHPEKHEIMQEIENIYLHMEKFFEFDQIADKSSRPNGLYLKKALLSGTLTISKKSESLRAVKRYLKTYKQRGLQQLGKIRSAPNMSNIYNELERKDYVISKMKQLCNSNEIRIISHLCQYNPKDVLKVLFQIRNLYKMYNDLETCDQCESSDLSMSVETGDITSCRKDSYKDQETRCVQEFPTNSFKVHIKTALNLHTKTIFLLISLSRVMYWLSFSPVFITIVDFAMDKGLHETDGLYIIGILSLGDLFGRLCLGWITDRNYISLPMYLFVTMSLLSACTASIPLMYSRWSLLLTVALFGMLQGSLFIRHHVLVGNYLKPNEHSIAMGCMEFFSGIVSIFFPLYIGYFRDDIGSYNYMYYINGIMLLLTGFLWLFESRLQCKSTISDAKQ